MEAVDTGISRSAITHALAGTRVPPRPVFLQMAEVYGAEGCEGTYYSLGAVPDGLLASPARLEQISHYNHRGLTC